MLSQGSVPPFGGLWLMLRDLVVFIWLGRVVDEEE